MQSARRNRSRRPTTNEPRQPISTHDPRDKQCTDRRSRLRSGQEDRVGHAALAGRNPFAHDATARGKSGRFAHTHGQPRGDQRGVAPGARPSASWRPTIARCRRRSTSCCRSGRPECPSAAGTAGRSTETTRTDSPSPPWKAELFGDGFGCDRQRHAVHVVDHGQREQKQTDPTSPPAHGALLVVIGWCVSLGGMLSRVAGMRQGQG